MVHLFRQLRLRLLKDQRIRRYLLYAAGEIMLVVVGILLALQINQWNEYRKDRHTELQALADLRSEFRNNQLEFDKHIDFKLSVTGEWKAFLTRISENDLTSAQKTVYRPRLATRSYSVANSKLKSLFSSGNIDKIRSDSLYNILNRWEDILKVYQESEVNQIKWGLDHLLPYEAQIIPFSMGIYKQVGVAFYDEQEQMRLLADALEDLQYQNLLIRNLFILEEQIRNAEVIKSTYADIIQLLDHEIKSF